MADESRTSEELTQLVRECVRSEMELQRSGRQGNTNLLSRTRDLIASSARSASQDVANSVMPSQSQTAQHVLAGTTNTTQTTFSRNSPGVSNTYPDGRPTTVLTNIKRAATSQHPWRLKKGKQKKTLQQQFYTKAVHPLDKPLDEYIGVNDVISDYSIKDDMVLLKCYVEIGTGQTEEEIRESITEVYMNVLEHSFTNLALVTIIDKVMF